MKEKISDATIDAINRLSPNILASHGVIAKARSGYICPFCGNGGGKDGTGISPLVADSHVGWKCHKCGENFNNMKIFSQYYNLDMRNDFRKLCESICADFNISIDRDAPLVTKTTEKKRELSPAELNAINDDIHTDIAPLRAFAAAQGGLWRGLPLKILERYGCRFIDAWTPPKARAAQKFYTPSPRMIIPANADGLHSNYLARLTCKLSDFDETAQKYIREKEHAGAKTLFNPDALSADVVFAVEGYVDCMTIDYAGYPCVALGGADGYQLLVDAVDALEKKPSVIILFDPDETGRKLAPKLQSGLKKVHCAAVTRFLSDDVCKLDANQILQENGVDFLIQKLSAIQQDALKEFETVRAENFPTVTGKDTTPKIADAMKRELDDAIIWLKSLTPETFTVADARNAKNIYSVALAEHFGFHADAENFFNTLKAAKKLAKERLKDDADAEFTQKLPDTARLELSALAEGVFINTLRKKVEEKTKAVARAIDRFRTEEQRRKDEEEAERKRQARLEKLEKNKSRLEVLREMEPSPERDTEMIQLIRDSCEWKCNFQGVRQYVKAVTRNTDKIFTFDPNIDGLFGYDDFLQADVFLKSPIWAPNKKRGDEWQDSDDEQLQLYLRRNYGELTNKDLIRQSITDYSRQRRFHEVRDYFKSLPQWDGIKRAETLYIDWLKVPDTQYAREVTIKHLLAAVARIFNPGCKFYWALVLRGNQKIGKSYIFQRLGGKWYKAISDRVDDPHAIDTLRLVWIGEFKEMSGMRKADVNAIKDFIELSADTRRLAYARRAGTYPRHCVFGITVNDDEFFTDVTGNRRFLVLDSSLPKFGYVKEVRGEKLSDDNVVAQIWAEVYHLYNQLFKGGFDERKLELSPETELEGERIAETYMRDDGLANEIQGYLNAKILPPFLWQLLTREERRDFIKNGQLVMLDAVREFNKRRRARGGNPDTVQNDVDAISNFIDGCDGKEFVYTDRVTVKGRETLEFHLHGSALRQHISAAEIFNECFGSDNRKRMTRINEILAHLDDWHLGARLRNADPAYPDQRKPYYRD